MPKWTKGSPSPNPTGRPKTSAVAELRAQIGTHLPELLNRVLLQALAGDPTAQRLLLDRVFPTLKPDAIPVHVELPEGTLTEMAKALLTAATSGTIAPDAAQQLLDSLSKIANIEALDELKKKLDDLAGIT